MLSEKRQDRMLKVAANRQPGLTVVLENIHDPHNVSAIFRSCDAVGIPRVALLYNEEKFPKIGKKSSASAFKWVDREKFTTVDECYAALRSRGFALYASALEPGAVSLYELDLTRPCALLMGNEHRGASPEALQHADKVFYIPMMGMVQSLNVSVAAAVSVYEALRQRLLLHGGTLPRPDAFDAILKDYTSR